MVYLEKNDPIEVQEMFNDSEHSIVKPIFSFLSDLCKEYYDSFYSTSISIINQNFNSEDEERKNQSCVLFSILFSFKSSLKDFEKPEIITLTEKIFEYTLTLKVN